MNDREASDDYYNRKSDRILGPARGIINGSAMGVVIWLAFAAGWFWLMG